MCIENDQCHFTIAQHAQFICLLHQSMLAFKKSDLHGMMPFTCVSISILYLFDISFFLYLAITIILNWLNFDLFTAHVTKQISREKERKRREEQTLMTGYSQVFIFLKRSKRYGSRLLEWKSVHAVLRSYIIKHTHTHDLTQEFFFGIAC